MMNGCIFGGDADIEWSSVAVGGWVGPPHLYLYLYLWWWHWMIIRGLVHLISRVLGCQIHQVAHHRKMLLNAISTDGTWAKTNFLNCTYISHAPISTHEQGANAHFLKARRYCTELFCAIRGYCTELFCAIRGYCTENLEQLATTRVLSNKLSWTDIARQRGSLQMVCFNVGCLNRRNGTPWPFNATAEHT